MKELIDRGTYQYSLNSLEEAKRDADSRAKTEEYYVLTDSQYYYGPVKTSKRKDIAYSRLSIAYTSTPKKGKTL